MMNIIENQINKLYVGYFDRAPDPAGLNFWIGQANAGGSIVDIAQSFAAGSEYASIYGGLGNSALIDKIYDNLFGRDPDAGGLAYWTAQLESGVSSGRLIVDIMSGAQGNDKTILENTTVVADTWTKSNAHVPFVMADAQNAVNSIGEAQGSGVNLIFKNDALLPYADIFRMAMRDAWAQWGGKGVADIELNFSDFQSDTLAFAYTKNELFTGQVDKYGSPITQTNIGIEMTTGKDMNGDLIDGTIYIAMNLERFFNYNITVPVLAHELGHIIGFRTEAFDFDSDLSSITSWDQFLTFPNGTKGEAYFNGPEAMQVYGGPVPVTGYYNATHPTVGIMHPSFGQDELVFVGVLEKAMLHDMGIMS